MCLSISQTYLADKITPKLSTFIAIFIAEIEDYYDFFHDTDSILKTGNFQEGCYELQNKFNQNISGRIKFYEMIYEKSQHWNFTEFAIALELKEGDDAISFEIHWHPDDSGLSFHDHLHVHKYTINLLDPKDRLDPSLTPKQAHINSKWLNSFNSNEIALLAYGSHIGMKRQTDLESGFCINDVTTITSLRSFFDEFHAHFHNDYLC
jgi:hypothetical protein